MSEIVIPVSEEWKRRAYVDSRKYESWYLDSVTDPNHFWGEQARKLDWIKPFTIVKDTSFRLHDFHINWFEDGRLNVAANCIDRHLKARGDQTAIIWEGDDPKNSRRITYAELHREVCRFANVLKTHGVRKGDRVTIFAHNGMDYLIGLFACWRISAIAAIISLNPQIPEHGAGRQSGPFFGLLAV